jgi:predicted polyphosphate/ATP-dependent NAD kinase
VFSNQEKVNIVRRVLLGLDALAVDTVLTMPDAFDICGKACDQVSLTTTTVEELAMLTEFHQGDSTLAALRMRQHGVACIVCLGGDGTSRAVAKSSAAVPLLPLSTGTNNVFPYMLEGTLAGLAAGIVARRLVTTPEAIVQRPRLDLEVNGEVVDLALVDAVVCDDRAIAARAIWDVSKVRLVVVAQRLLAQIGFMGLAGNLPCPEAQPDHGMLIETDPAAPPVLAPIAPGLIVPVGIRRYAPLAMGERVELPSGVSYTIALDGERERKIRPHDRVAICLHPQGPRVINPHVVLAQAAARGVFLQQPTPLTGE